MEKRDSKKVIIIAIAILMVMIIAIVFIVADIVEMGNGTDGTGGATNTASEIEKIDSEDTQNTAESENSQESQTTEGTQNTEGTEGTEGTQNTEENSEPETPKDPNMYSDASGYMVYDPNNTRGLDETGKGFGFGYASGGQPHEISINNQKYFESLEGVEALALDVKSTDKRIYLTFDCGYEYNNHTQVILDILKEKNVKAAFFCTLDFIKDCPDTVQRMIDEGHIVGNHSTTHPVFPTLTREEMAKELYTVDKYMQDTYGYHSPYFRFPTGENSVNSLELCTSVGYRSIFWSIAYDDWYTESQHGYDYAFDKITSRLHPGAVILLHSVSADNISVLGDVIDYARNNGYTFTTLDEYPW